jgi:hypothetical protein
MTLPKLIDCKGIQEEMGIKRSAAEALMRKVPKVQIEGHRKVFVRRADLEEYLRQQQDAA